MKREIFKMAVFRTGGTLILPIILSIMIYSRPGLSIHRAFSCPFDDVNYNLRLFSNIYDARFGNNPNGILVGPIQDFLNHIESIYDRFLATGLKFNSIGNFLRFYGEYQSVKDCPKFPGFRKFFQNYKGDIQPDEDPMGNIITLMKLLTSNPSEKTYFISENSYLVTASPFPGSSYDATLDKPDALTEPSFWKHEHVAGIIKFGMPVTYNKIRYGYMLLDPKYLEKPLVFMDDMGDLPVKHEYSEAIRNRTSGKNIVFRKMWYVGDEANATDVTESNFLIGKYGAKEIVYFFRKPYCTFMEHTVKPSLLVKYRSVEKYDEQNKHVAQVVVEIQDKQAGAPAPLDAYFSMKNYLGQWRPWTFPTIGNSSEIRNAMEIISGPLNILCSDKYLKISRRIVPRLCVDFWAGRIKQFKRISEDTEFLREADRTLALYRNRRLRPGWFAREYISARRPEERVPQTTDMLPDGDGDGENALEPDVKVAQSSETGSPGKRKSAIQKMKVASGNTRKRLVCSWLGYA